MQVSSEPRVLVGTLYSGENEFDRCKASLEAQSYTSWDHVVFEGLGNQEAHARLYTTFKERSGEYDLFVKLDADMVFLDETGIEQIVKLFRTRPNLDHAVLAVHDWASDSLLMGLHIFSKRVVWGIDQEQLFVDPSPRVMGRRLVTKRAPAPLVTHAPDPSPFQALHFGVHRALKAVQPEREDFRPIRAEEQWRLLKRIWRRFRTTRIRVLGLTVLGADLVLQGQISPEECDYTNPSLRAAFEGEWADLSSDEIYDEVQARWSSALRREAIYRCQIGLVRYIRGIGGGALRRFSRTRS